MYVAVPAASEDARVEVGTMFLGNKKGDGLAQLVSASQRCRREQWVSDRRSPRHIYTRCRRGRRVQKRSTARSAVIVRPRARASLRVGCTALVSWKAVDFNAERASAESYGGERGGVAECEEIAALAQLAEAAASSPDDRVLWQATVVNTAHANHACVVCMGGINECGPRAPREPVFCPGLQGDEEFSGAEAGSVAGDRRGTVFRRAMFPTTAAGVGDGTPLAFRMLMGVAKELAKTLTRTQTDRFAGAVIARFLSFFNTEYRSMQIALGETAPATDDSMALLLQRAMGAALDDRQNRNAPLLCGYPTPVWLSRASLSDTCGQWAQECFDRRDREEEARFRRWEQSHSLPPWQQDIVGQTTAAGAAVLTHVAPDSHNVGPTPAELAQQRAASDGSNLAGSAPEAADRSEQLQVRQGSDDRAETLEQGVPSTLPMAAVRTSAAVAEASNLEASDLTLNVANPRKRARHAPVAEWRYGALETVGTGEERRKHPVQCAPTDCGAPSSRPVWTQAGETYVPLAQHPTNLSCWFCRRVVKLKSVGNLKQHLEAKHKLAYQTFLLSAAAAQSGVPVETAIVTKASEATERLFVREKMCPQARRRVEVYFEHDGDGEGAWYKGVVTGSGINSENGLTTILFDDGQRELYDFVEDTDEKWRYSSS